MKNFSKRLSSFFAAFAMVFTMGTAATTTSAEAGCHHRHSCHLSCATLKSRENHYTRQASYYKQGTWHYNYFMGKVNYYRNRYIQSGCQTTPPPAKTGSLCGYVFINGKADRSDGTPVTITQPDGSLLRTTVQSDGKWSVSNVKAGNVSVHLDEKHFNLKQNEILRQVYGKNSSFAVVVANKLNDGKVDNYTIEGK